MGSGDNIYDRSRAPKEGISSISARARQRLYGRPEPQNFSDWYAQQQRGPAPGPVKTEQTSTGQNDFYTGNAPTLTLDPQQQLLGNMFKPESQTSQTQAPGGSPEQLKMWIDWLREKQASDISQNPERVFQAQAQANDPVRFAQENYQARLASDPWGPGGQFENAYHLTPTAALASQGNNATNQWAQRGGVTYGGQQIDPEELKRMNAVAASGRKTYI